MPFPTTPILDTFTGADENPITTNWTCPLWSTDGNLRRLSNALTKPGASFDSGYYDLATFGPNCEIWGTLVTKTTTDLDYIRLCARMTDAGTATPDGYSLHVETRAAGNDKWTITRIDNGGPVPIGVSPEQEVANGDGIGLSIIGDQLEAWHRASGIWSLLFTRTDSTYSTAGYLGVDMKGGAGTIVFDDFGGGTIGGVTYGGSRFPASMRVAEGS